MKKNSRIYAISLVLLGLLASFSSTYAFWQGSVSASSSTNDQNIYIGSWDFEENTYVRRPRGIPEFVLGQYYPANTVVWYDGAFYITRGDGWQEGYPPSPDAYSAYNMITINHQIGNTYYNNDVVYYEGCFYRVIDAGNANNHYPGTTMYGWYNMNSIDFNSHQRFMKNDYTIYQGVLYVSSIDNQEENVYTTPDLSKYWHIAGSMEYDSSIRYYADDIIAFNGSYYRAAWETIGSNPANTNPWGTWIKITLSTYETGITYSNGQIILYGGHQYKVMNSALTATHAPGTIAGVYKQIDTYTYTTNNTYLVGDVVMYDGQYWKAVNAENAQNNLPGTIKNAWNLLNTSDYQWFNTYSSGDHVVYHGKKYTVYDASRASLYAPNSEPRAWNIVNTFSYNNFTVYTPGVISGISIYNDVAYRALQETVSNYPPVDPIPSNTYWTEY